MRPLSSDIREFLKEVGWAIFVLDLIVAFFALLMSRHVGGVAAVWIFVVFAGVATAILGGLAVLNVGAVVLWEAWRARRRSGGQGDGRREVVLPRSSKPG